MPSACRLSSSASANIPRFSSTEHDPDFTAASHNLNDLVSSEALDRLHHEEILERGPVCDVVFDVIRQKDIDLLVLGTRGRSGFRKLLLGSVAEELFRRASCPVLTVGPAAVPIRPIRHVLYVTAFGPASLRALPYAIDLANKNRGELILLHLVPPMPRRVHWSVLVSRD